jgi:hypothetical protein
MKEKGFLISSGYVGIIDSKGTRQEFETEEAYLEYMREEQ